MPSSKGGVRGGPTKAWTQSSGSGFSQPRYALSIASAANIWRPSCRAWPKAPSAGKEASSRGSVRARSPGKQWTSSCCARVYCQSCQRYGAARRQAST
eukprot:scaffold3124_cov390-Prasinococcus_capsulatus_cf.AAC.7